ncbi:leucine-rich repeat domain-containing protein [Prevotella sp. HUN102]|nr:leucine-rich repeat domain-containing protein [Prevotella sp. HUN102]
MKVTRFCTNFAQTVYTLAMVMTINLMLAACSNDDKDEAPPVPDGMVMTTAAPVGEEIQFLFAKDDEPLVKGATEVRREWEHMSLRTYRVVTQTITITGRVTHLECYGIKLTRLDVRGNKHLKTLRCGYNLLTSLNVNGCVQLEYLDCSANQLTLLNASACTRLKAVTCFKNRLTYESVKLPKVGNGTLMFKNTKEGDTQKLTPTQVTELKKKGWKVEQWRWNNEDYPGE